MKSAFVLLAHEQPNLLKELIETIVSQGADIYIHYDLNSPYDLEKCSRSWNIDKYPGKIFFAERVKVVWGEWSIVQATLNCFSIIKDNGFSSDYYTLISGSCFPLKPLFLFDDYLEKSGKDHIECVDAIKNKWVIDGLQIKRWNKYHIFNWRKNPFLFSMSVSIQTALFIDRKPPLDHTPHMGSQWWSLRRGTIEKILDLIIENPRLITFYKYTWVPDELFFQTIVGNIVPNAEVDKRLVTKYKFTRRGVPRVYYDDDYPELLAESHFFARKISHNARFLRSKLASLGRLNSTEYKAYLSSQSHLLCQLKEKNNFFSELKDNEWHNLFTRKENKYDFIKAIPNPIIIVLGENREDKLKALEALDKLEGTVVYGDLFDAQVVGRGYKHSSELGIQLEQVELARHTWYQLFGDIAYLSPGKTIVFSLGKDALKYLEVLRWRSSLQVLMLEKRGIVSFTRELFLELYAKSKMLHFLQDRHCELSLATPSMVENWVDYCSEKKFSGEYIRQCIRRSNLDTELVPLLKKSTSSSEVVMSLDKPLVLFITDSYVNLTPLGNIVKKSTDGILHTGLFGVIAKNDKSNDWYYYLNDIAHLNAEQNGCPTLFVVTAAEKLHKLRILKRKRDLLLVHVRLGEAQYEDVYLPQGNLRLLETQHNVLNRESIKCFMSDAECRFISIKSDNLEDLGVVLREHSKVMSLTPQN